MSTKIKRVADNICPEKGIINYQENETVDYSQDKIKSHQHKSDYLILFFTYLFISFLPKNESRANQHSFFSKALKQNEFKIFYKLFLNIIINAISYSSCLNIFLDILFRHLYFAKIVQFHIIIKFNDYYENNILNLLDFINELYLYNLVFFILLNKTPITALSAINSCENKRISFELAKKGNKGNYISVFFKQNNITTNTCELIDDEEIKNDDFIIDIQHRKKGKKILIRNINHLRNFIQIIKHILLLLNLFKKIFVYNKISDFEYNSYNITLKIKGTGNKQIFSSHTDFFKSEYYPNEVYINGNQQNDVSHSYYLNQTDNFIKLIWYNLISSCDCMFYDCSDIIEIDFSSFDTSNVDNMRAMFYNCKSLTSLNLSNFNTSKVKMMNMMFNQCTSLTSLNLSNFDTSKVKWIHKMFEGCTNLEYINMIDFNEGSLVDNYYHDMFCNVPGNIAICINKVNILTKIYPQISTISCHIEDCTNDSKLNQNKFIQGTEQCVNNCSDINLYEYNGQCVSQCPKGYFYDKRNITKCKCELEKCFTCPKIALIKELCTKCNNNYYPMENDPLNLGEYFNCYNETPKGYYLDKFDELYKRCYYTCETCEIKGDNKFHNCLKCKSEFNFEIYTNNYTNCFVNCSYYYYFDNNNSLFNKFKIITIAQKIYHVLQNFLI